MRSDTKTFFYDYLHVIMGRVGSGVLGLANLFFIVRILNPESYGSYALFISVALMFAVLTIWLSGSIVRFGREEFITEGSIKKTFWAHYWILLPFFFLCLILIVIFQTKLSHYIGITQNYCYLIFAHVLLTNLSANLPAVFQAMGKMKFFAYLPLIFSGIFSLALLVIYFNPFTVSVEMIIGFSLVGHLLCAIVGLFLLRKYIIPSCFPRDWIKKCFFYSYPLALGNAAGLVVKNIDQMLIRVFMPLTFVGIYNVAYLLQDNLALIPRLSISLMFPLMTSLIVLNKEAKIGQYIRTFASQINFTWALTVSLVLVFNREILLLFGQSYASASLPFAILLIGVAFQIINIIISPIFSSYGLMKEATMISVAMAAINIGLDYLLIPKIQISGAAIATTSVIVFGGFASIFVLNIRLGINNFKSCLWLFPSIVVFIGTFFIPDLVPRIIFLLIVIAISLIGAKRGKIFSIEALGILDSIDMPALLRQTIKKIYSFMI